MYKSIVIPESPHFSCTRANVSLVLFIPEQRFEHPKIREYVNRDKIKRHSRLLAQADYTIRPSPKMFDWFTKDLKNIIIPMNYSLDASNIDEVNHWIINNNIEAESEYGRVYKKRDNIIGDDIQILRIPNMEDFIAFKLRF